MIGSQIAPRVTLIMPPISATGIIVPGAVVLVPIRHCISFSQEIILCSMSAMTQTMTVVMMTIPSKDRRCRQHQCAGNKTPNHYQFRFRHQILLFHSVPMQFDAWPHKKFITLRGWSLKINEICRSKTEPCRVSWRR